MGGLKDSGMLLLQENILDLGLFQTFRMWEEGEGKVIEQLIDASEECWISALDIAVQKPHSLDKRLAGATEIASWRGEREKKELVQR